MLNNCVGAPDERFEEKELRIAELEEKCEDLEKDIFKLKQNVTQTAGFTKKPRDEGDKLLSDLTK